MAVHSVTHDNTEKYWDEGTQETWEEEMAGGRAITSAWANIQPDETQGARAPLLRLGGNRQFDALANTGFAYDASMVAPLSNPPYWPYPLEYASPHRCHGNFQVCPSRSHAGVMEMVSVGDQDETSGNDTHFNNEKPGANRQSVGRSYSGRWVE